MKFVPTSSFSIPALRAIASKKPVIDRANFYLPHVDRIKKTFSDLGIFEMSKLIFKETDHYLQELECMVLANKLTTYVGPLTLEYLDSIIEVFPIEAIWLLASTAQMNLIKEKAQIKLNEILDQYYDETVVSPKKKRKKRGDNNEKHKRR